MEFNFNSFGNSKQSISYCEVDKCKAVVDLKQQLDQLKAQLEAYKMESEEGKEINAELKAENEILKQYRASKQASYENMQREWNDAVNENRELKQTLTEIKEIAQDFGFNGIYEDCFTCIQKILQICDEVNDV